MCNTDTALSQHACAEGVLPDHVTFPGSWLNNSKHLAESEIKSLSTSNSHNVIKTHFSLLVGWLYFHRHTLLSPFCNDVDFHLNSLSMLNMHDVSM